LTRIALGERTEEELTSLEAHLDRCADCRRIVAATIEEQPVSTPTSHSFLPRGRNIGRYILEAPLGMGGMGIVYAARDGQLGRTVALKLLRSGNDRESNARLAREAQTMAQLSHPNLVPVFELGEWEGGLYLTMERVDGVSLDTWRRDGRHAFGEVLQVVLDAGRGLAAAHAAGVVHRDFKPGNVLVGPDRRVRVTDFGLSRAGVGIASPSGHVAGSAVETQAGTLLGTPAYMSPEQLAGEAVDARSDQFSFCVTLVEALTGHRPFNAETPAALRKAMQSPPDLSGIPRRLQRVLARGLSFEARERFPSMEELFASLAAGERLLRIVAASAVVMLLLLAGILLPRVLFPVHREPIKLFAGWPMVVGMGESATVDNPDIAYTKITSGSVVVIGTREGRCQLTITFEGRSTVQEVEVVAGGFQLVQVAVLGTDVPAGAVVYKYMLEQRGLPAFMTNSGVVKWDQIDGALNRHARVQMGRGDLLRWNHLGEHDDVHEGR
jgi:serine/threonine-protein kinase